MAQIKRRKTYTVVIGGVRVGSDAPVVVQSMTNTDTADVPGTIRQVADLARAGSELVRVTVNNDAAAKAVPAIVEGLEKQGVRAISSDCAGNGAPSTRLVDSPLFKSYSVDTSPDCCSAEVIGSWKVITSTEPLFNPASTASWRPSDALITGV